MNIASGVSERECRAVDEWQRSGAHATPGQPVLPAAEALHAPGQPSRPALVPFRSNLRLRVPMLILKSSSAHAPSACCTLPSCSACDALFGSCHSKHNKAACLRVRDCDHAGDWISPLGSRQGLMVADEELEDLLQAVSLPGGQHSAVAYSLKIVAPSAVLALQSAQEQQTLGSRCSSIAAQAGLLMSPLNLAR